MKSKNQVIIFNSPPTLRQFLTLNTQEQKSKEIFEQMIAMGKENSDLDVESIFKKIIASQQNILLLIRIAENSPKIFNFLRHEQLQIFWQEAWRLMGNNPLVTTSHKDISYHEMRPQTELNSFFLFLGYFYFQEAMKVRELKEKKYTYDEITYLKKAESYYSFHAINALNKHDLEDLKICANQKTHNFRLEKILYRVSLAARYHKTPGLLLQAETHYAIACYYQALDIRERISSALLLAIQALKSAELNLKNCEASINNAYFGKGLAASNALGLGTIQDIKKLFLQMAGNYLTSEDISFADQAARLASERPG